MHASSDWPLGLAHFTCIGVTPVDLVRLGARTGCAAVGLRLYPAFPGAPFYALPAGSDVFREMRRALADEGMRVHDIEFVTLSEDFVPASLAGMLESAAGLGARRLSVCGDDPDRPRLVARFAELCDLAAGFGLGVDLECMAWRQVASLPDAVRVVEAAGRPNGGVLVDALHLARTGGSPEDVRAVPPGLIRHAQLCDAPAEAPRSTDAIIQEARAGRLPPGDGALPLRALVAALPATASLSIEVPITGATAPEDHVRANLAAARRLLAG
ncbi:Sugar phosphate isomerase/epimerase [Methylobacterium sp. 174MFSha1.1]|uniref:sugar phosphate isomerase/epimerase family protein n=1 Tax=Methylobacterium sp. 174MFSha1.1 TaxID=1502749 RepID=UPI0008F348F2|nr:TIM barrel protein [Methylobacterium sp. 174MFSha1.1]SFU91125.1 Sugar phosphate isomerase/epimerase [Methylobacterium sp. 174MFSha1.1]